VKYPRNDLDHHFGMVPRFMRPANRQALASDPSKSSKFPRTNRRVERIADVISRRQPDLTIVLENVHDPHNIGAVLRSCDAVGMLEMHTIYTIEQRPERAYARSTSGSASKWIDVHHHDSVEHCYRTLRESGHKILVAALTEESVGLYETTLTVPVALVFGNENRGASNDAITLADETMLIPMMGMVESLNISVACAVTLFEAMRQRQEAGMYSISRLDQDLQKRLAHEWLKR
jgi:tRNA (guanosine-2'-O-)-methyltransferase